MNQKNAPIIITGSSGRIGDSASELLSREYPIIALDVIPPKLKRENVYFYRVDLSSDENMHQVFGQIKQQWGTKISSVLHLAAYYNFSGGHWDQYEQITIGGTRRMLTELKSFQVEQFIFSSTMLVYAPCEPGEKINEQSVVFPKWEYPKSKVITEDLIHKMRGPIHSVILRIAGVYDDHCHSIPISEQVQRIYEKQLESHFFPGNLTHGASYIHMDDLVKVIQVVIEKRRGLPEEALFVIGEPKTLSYQQMQNTIGQILYAKPWKTIRVPKWFAKLGAWVQNTLPFFKKSFIKPWMIDLADDHYELDVSLAIKMLGWMPAKNLESTLIKMLQDLKTDPKKWYEENKLELPKKLQH